MDKGYLQLRVSGRSPSVVAIGKEVLCSGDEVQVAWDTSRWQPDTRPPVIGVCPNFHAGKIPSCVKTGTKGTLLNRATGGHGGPTSERPFGLVRLRDTELDPQATFGLLLLQLWVIESSAYWAEIDAKTLQKRIPVLVGSLYRNKRASS